jgi:hypothetical protein
MTEKETIEYIIEKRRFPRKLDDYAIYIFIVFPVGFVAIGSSMI